jgi:predicted ATPase
MVEQPSGTVTLVFTDIEGSTLLLRELGREAYREALSEYRRIVREAFAGHGGYEVDYEGDAFFYALQSAVAAVAAVEQAMRGLESAPIRIRVGVHTGEPGLDPPKYVGMDVHLAARIMSAGHGGQVLLSKATRDLVAVEAKDLGEHRLRDITDPVWLYQLGDEEFPPLRSLFLTNLPTPATPFLGRQREVAELVELLSRDEVRLVTLTGSGGTGKTRLAVQAAGLAADGYPNGVWWVPLPALRDPQLVLAAAAQALGAENAIAEHIGDRRMLILFDNFEQVVGAGPGLGELLRACPRLDLVVTSREPLHLAAEWEYPVPPLDHAEAVEFFHARARAIKPDFEANGEVSEICRRLDDLPLALELAAARVKAVSPEQLLARLERRLPLLTRGARDLPERQQTLRAAIAWSYDLLTEEEQRLFRRVCVFAGGCTLDAAESVADADLDTLYSLVDKNLLRHSDERYWMLESIREYATERLEESGEAGNLRARHARFFLARAESSGLSLEPEGEQRYDLVRGELNNLRAALDWSLQADPELGLRLATALEMFWVITDPSEGMRWFETLLEKATDAPSERRAHALRAYGSQANPAGEDALAERLYQQSLDAFRQLGDERGAALLLLRLGMSAFYRADDERAGELAAESLALNRQVGNPVGEAEALGLAGEVEYRRGNRQAGVELIERSASLAGDVGFTWWRSRMLRKLVDCLLELERTGEAEAWAQESLRLAYLHADTQAIIFALARLARLAAETGRLERAGLLWGSIEAEEARRRMGGWEQERDTFAAPVLARTGAAFKHGRDNGRRLQLDHAVRLALDDAEA